MSPYDPLATLAVHCGNGFEYLFEPIQCFLPSFFLYALAAGGQDGVERALGNLRAECERNLKLMGCRSVDQLSRAN